VAIVLHRPRAVRVGFAAQPEPVRRRHPGVVPLLDLVARGFLMGVALGMLTFTGHQAIVSVTAIGVVALGVALVSWDR